VLSLQGGDRTRAPGGKVHPLLPRVSEKLIFESH
jgi:hypothetical protein